MAPPAIHALSALKRKTQFQIPDSRFLKRDLRLWNLPGAVPKKDTVQIPD